MYIPTNKLIVKYSMLFLPLLGTEVNPYSQPEFWDEKGGLNQ